MILVAASGRASRVLRIVTADGDVEIAEPGDSVTLTLSDEVDISRGDILASPKHRPEVADQFAAHLVWMGGEPLLPGRSYLMKIGARTVPATITELKHRVDIATLAHHAAKTLAMNEIGLCNVATLRLSPLIHYAANRTTGAFILIDRYSNATVAAGMIIFELRRATNIHRQNLIVSKTARAQLKRQRPAILWFTGLSGAGKSTIANLVEAQLHARGVHTFMLDADNVRHGLNKDLGFNEADRVENIRRVGEVAKLMTEAGLVVLCSLISPFRAERHMVRELVGPREFIEIFVDTPLEECIARDPKGLYSARLREKSPTLPALDRLTSRPKAQKFTCWRPATGRKSQPNAWSKSSKRVRYFNLGGSGSLSLDQSGRSRITAADDRSNEDTTAARLVTGSSPHLVSFRQLSAEDG